MNSKSVIFIVLVIIALVAIFVDPIPQDLNYHLFADNFKKLGVNNFWNVMSNIPFLIVGVLGLWSLFNHKLKVGHNVKLFYLIFFLGIIFVGLGSSWYHLNPNNQTLVWDRLPMTISFMAFFAVILAEHVNEKLGKNLLWPLIAIGLLSIFYWQYTESIGSGDLRWYGLVQFLPLILIPIILVVFPKKYTQIHLLWLFLGMYVVAKILEYFDAQTLELLQVISGHSLKHIAAALGIYFYWRYLRTREVLKL